ncbi:hypothetical protein [Mycolicibacterium mageritense]|uniref:hypothetical protein n=1 Tax=Mycolicibacterium mageritense TaxID=53462 RepID=UPI001E2DFA6D|nr:hypothetical protein [Mycolicibacterium mageritense]GJJ22281.1 hypothetical protein MTY414_59540 [Mycolicibacterium mageritense]
MSDSLKDAQEQADTYDGFARSATITARKSGEVFTIGNPLFFDDDQLAAYQALHHRMNQCDRWPDTEIPEQSIESTDPNGATVKTHNGAHVRRGDYIEPYQETDKDGVTRLVDPPYEVQVAKIVLGEEDYARFKAGGGSSRELTMKLQKLRERVEEREAADPKSVGGAADSAAVAASDSK